MSAKSPIRCVTEPRALLPHRNIPSLDSAVRCMAPSSLMLPITLIASSFALWAKELPMRFWQWNRPLLMLGLKITKCQMSEAVLSPVPAAHQRPTFLPPLISPAKKAQNELGLIWCRVACRRPFRPVSPLFSKFAASIIRFPRLVQPRHIALPLVLMPFAVATKILSLPAAAKNCIGPCRFCLTRWGQCPRNITTRQNWPHAPMMPTAMDL